ncbi:hypothetical protein R3P38DRAFT_2891252 [Favolaschia claudopus]|uniref:Uncharacterized protein n=1 Tax=Favolaschia claudopus TaxID=2862362 RepID=A0AAW0CRU5_9AGAR
MDSTENAEDVPKPIDKGKRRAEDPTERTPLLGSSSSSAIDDPPPAVARRRLISKLTTVFLGTLVFSICAFVALALLAWSYASRATHVSPDDILNQGLVFEGPDRVDVLNITSSGGLWVNVEARVGFDAGSVIGVNSSPDGDGFFQDIWKSIGRWGVRTLDRVSVNMTNISLTSESVVLATIYPTPVVLPLTANPPSDSSWLTHISTPLLIQPTSNTSALVHFVREAWREGSAAVAANVASVDVQGGGFAEESWRSILHSALSDVRTALRLKIPPIPGIPQHGPIPPLTELVTLQSFDVRSSPNSLELAARASIPNPAPPSFNLTSPSIPFTIALPTSADSGLPAVPIASVTTAPFTLTHPNITLTISGSVLPLPAYASALLSTLLTRYLSGLPNPILVSTPYFPDLTVPLDFPGPNPRPHILRNVTIQDMVIKPHASSFVASGTVFARVVLPLGMDVSLHVGRVLPDVLVFDGEVPSIVDFPKTPNPRHDDPTPAPPPPFPDPLPEHAFGHIRPDDWLVSQSTPVPSEDGEGAAFAVTAKIVDVPLEVLPGRQKEFRNFVSKVIFGSDGAVAGIMGVAGVAVDVVGLPIPTENGEMELHGLPFQGKVPVGKKSLLGLGGAAKRGAKELKKELDKFLHRWQGK